MEGWLFNGRRLGMMHPGATGMRRNAHRLHVRRDKGIPCVIAATLSAHQARLSRGVGMS